MITLHVFCFVHFVQALSISGTHKVVSNKIVV